MFSAIAIAGDRTCKLEGSSRLYWSQGAATGTTLAKFRKQPNNLNDGQSSTSKLNPREILFKDKVDL